MIQRALLVCRQSICLDTEYPRGDSSRSWKTSTVASVVTSFEPEVSEKDNRYVCTLFAMDLPLLRRNSTLESKHYLSSTATGIRLFWTTEKWNREAILVTVDPNLPLVVETDASDVAISATLNQEGRPVLQWRKKRMQLLKQPESGDVLSAE